MICPDCGSDCGEQQICERCGVDLQIEDAKMSEFFETPLGNSKTKIILRVILRNSSETDEVPYTCLELVWCALLNVWYV